MGYVWVVWMCAMYGRSVNERVRQVWKKRLRWPGVCASHAYTRNVDRAVRVGEGVHTNEFA